MTTATPTPVPLQNPTFDGISWNEIPGWRTGAWVTWAPGQEFDKVNAFAEPNFHQADDPRQWINGSTLQIDTVAWVKLRAWVYQTVAVEAGSTVQFEVRAVGFVKELAGGYIFRAGVDPAGRDGCDGARWGEERLANQQDGVIVLTSPKVAAGQTGQVTLCIFAETQFAQEYHAAFLDDAEMIVLPPAP